MSILYRVLSLAGFVTGGICDWREFVIGGICDGWDFARSLNKNSRFHHSPPKKMVKNQMKCKNNLQEFNDIRS